MLSLRRLNEQKGADSMKERHFSAPGRVEIGGNHTDHQHGCVLAAATNLDAKCSAVPNGTNIVNITRYAAAEMPSEICLS